MKEFIQCQPGESSYELASNTLSSMISTLRIALDHPQQNLEMDTAIHILKVAEQMIEVMDEAYRLQYEKYCDKAEK